MSSNNPLLLESARLHIDQRLRDTAEERRRQLARRNATRRTWWAPARRR